MLHRDSTQIPPSSSAAPTPQNSQPLNVAQVSYIDPYSDSFTILGLWVLGLAVSNINESQLQTYESKTLFLMTSLQYYYILGLARTH